MECIQIIIEGKGVGPGFKKYIAWSFALKLHFIPTAVILKVPFYGFGKIPVYFNQLLALLCQALMVVQ